MELAECEEQLGKLVEAQVHWAAARDTAKHDEKPQSRARAEQRLAAVDKRVAHLTLQLAADAPAGAQVFSDDAPLDPAALGSALSLNPGDHAVVVKVAGHDDAKYAVKLAEGDTQTLPITAGPATAPAAPPPAPPPTMVAPPTNQDAHLSTSSWSGQRTTGIIVGAVGAVGVGLGSVLWSVGYSGANSLGPSADQQLLAGQISVISGGILLVTGVVLFATAPHRESRRPFGALANYADVDGRQPSDRAGCSRPILKRRQARRDDFGRGARCGRASSASAMRSRTPAGSRSSAQRTKPKASSAWLCSSRAMRA